MQELIMVMNSVATLLAVVAGGLSVVAVCYAGILWMTASGDPQKMGQARMALMGAIGGLVIVGIAFLVPQVISEAVLEPLGITPLVQEVSIDCDSVLRNQLVFQRAASNASRIQQVVSRIQASNSDYCSSDQWDPMVNDDNYVVDYSSPAGLGGILNRPCTGTPGSPTCPNVSGSLPLDDGAGCFRTDYYTDDSFLDSHGSNARVGLTPVPSGLKVQRFGHSFIRPASGRDSQNNVVVYWDGTSRHRPSDGSRCWLYVRSIAQWDESY